MRITVTQSGGRADEGEVELVSLDTGRLHAQAAGRVRGRLAAEGFFSLPAHAAGGGGTGGAWYRIVVEEDSYRHMVTFEDDGSPAAASLKALVEALVADAGAQAKTLNQARHA